MPRRQTEWRWIRREGSQDQDGRQAPGERHVLSLVHVRPLRIHVRPPPVRARCVPLRLERPQVARHRPVPAVRVLAGSQSALPRHVAARPLDVKDAGGAGARDPAYEDASDTPGLMQKPQSMGTTHILPAHQAKVKTIGPTESHEREDVFVSRGTDPNSLPRFRERLSASAACLPRGAMSRTVPSAGLSSGASTCAQASAARAHLSPRSGHQPFVASFRLPATNDNNRLVDLVARLPVRGLVACGYRSTPAFRNRWQNLRTSWSQTR